MSLPKQPDPAKLVIGIFVKDKDKTLLDSLAGKLVHLFGPIDMASGWLSFDYTDYYAHEMGSPLFRRMLVFKNLISQDRLPEIKLETNALETVYSIDGRRRVNIDPGYMLLERFVLATGKNFSHRIYIGKRIYADLTLIFQQGDFQCLPWTYPDYADNEMQVFLKQVREKYRIDKQRLTI